MTAFNLIQRDDYNENVDNMGMVNILPWIEEKHLCINIAKVMKLNINLSYIYNLQLKFHTI